VENRKTIDTISPYILRAITLFAFIN